MTDKEFILSIYPDAKCRQQNPFDSAHKYHRYDILIKDRLFVSSFSDEATAWKWAAVITNARFLNKLSQ